MPKVPMPKVIVVTVALIVMASIIYALWETSLDGNQEGQPSVRTEPSREITEAFHQAETKAPHSQGDSSEMSVDTKYQELERSEQELRQDYLWIDYYKLREGRYWSKLSSDGGVLWVRFGVPGTYTLSEVRAGTLSSEETSWFFDSFGKIEFFELQSEYQPIEGVIYEGDVLTVFAYYEGNSHRVSSRPPGFVPEGLLQIVNSFEEKISKLESQSDHKLFIRAGVVNPNRAQRLKDRGRSFIPFSNEQLEEHPSVKKAVEEPNTLVSVNLRESQKINQYLAGENYFYLYGLDGYFQLQVFTFEKGT
jgi:hypothetical protein